MQTILQKVKTPRDKGYMDWISRLPCIVCGIQLERSDPHHTESGGKGIKGSDYSCLPFCHLHHVEIHQTGKTSFARKYGLNIQDIIERLNRVWEIMAKEA